MHDEQQSWRDLQARLSPRRVQQDKIQLWSDPEFWIPVGTILGLGFRVSYYKFKNDHFLVLNIKHEHFLSL